MSRGLTLAGPKCSTALLELYKASTNTLETVNRSAAPPPATESEFTLWSSTPTHRLTGQLQIYLTLATLGPWLFSIR